MPTISLNPTVRFVLYVLAALGSAIAAYLFAKGIVGDAELGLWAAIVAIVNGIAAANTNTNTAAPTQRPQILGKAFTGGTFSKAEEDARHDGDPHRP
jgi:hypothetical protein